jgi:hypothetical protein
MAEDPAQIRDQINAVRLRLEHDLERLQPIVLRRLSRAKRLGELAAVAVLTLAVMRLLVVLKPALRRRSRTRRGRCPGLGALLRRR